MSKQQKGKDKKDKDSKKAAQPESPFISSKEGRIRDIRDVTEVQEPYCRPAAYYNETNLQIGAPDDTSSGVYTLQPAYLTIHPFRSGATVKSESNKHIINQAFVDLPNVNMIIFEILIKVYDFVHDNIKSTTRIESIDYSIFTGLSSKKKGGGPTFTDTNTMKEDFSFILTEIISYAGPVLIEEIREIYYQVYKKESDLFSENEILLISFIFVINKLFTLYTGYYNNYALTTFFPTKIFTNENEEIIIEGLDPVSIKDVYKNIKLIKLSFIQTLIEAFYSSTKYNFNFDNETQNIFYLFSNNFDLFFDRYLEHLVENTALLEQKEPLMPIIKVEENEKNLSVSESTPILSSSQSVPILSSQSQSYSPDKKLYGGTKRGDFLQTFIDNCGVNRGHISVTPYLNNQILRVIVCQLLTSLSILQKVVGAVDISNNDEPPNYPPIPTNVLKSSKNIVLSDTNNYTLTEFGKHLKTKNYNTNISNFHESMNDMPTNQSQRHRTKALIENILDQLEPIWKSDISKAHSFSSFADYEHGLEHHFYDMAFENGMFFRMPVIPKLSEDDKKKCCPYRFIIDNASTVLNAQGTFVPRDPNPSSADNKLDSLASILDPAGSINIKINDAQEYGNIHCIVLGNKLEMGGRIEPDMNVIFRGNIDFEPNFEIEYYKSPKVNKSCIRNSSINTIINKTSPISSINVNCDLIITFDSTDPGKPLLLGDMEREFSNSKKKDAAQVAKATKEDDMKDRPSETTLESTREFNIRQLMRVIEEEFNPKINLLDPYYRDMKYVNDLISGTLMKTLGDLMQVLLALIKFGGINDLWSFGKDVIPYDRAGNALRVVSHHDLTASVITYFLLIFGNYLFIPQADTTWQMIDPQQNNLHNYINHGKNMGAAMNDHTLVRFAVGNINDINRVMDHFNEQLSGLVRQFGGEKYNCEKLKGFHIAVVSSDDNQQLSAEIKKIKSAMDLLKEDLNEKKRIIVILENLNQEITHKLKEAIIEGKQKNFFLENLLTAILAIASESYFVNIFNCKYLNLVPSLLLNDSRIIGEICSIIYQILDIIKQQAIDPSTIDINLRFDQIRAMGIDLSHYEILSGLKLKGVRSIIEIVSSVINDEELRNIIDNYLFLIDRDNILKGVCENIAENNEVDAKNFMVLVISIMDFVASCEMDRGTGVDVIQQFRADFQQYGENGVNFIIEYLCYDFCNSYTINLFDFDQYHNKQELITNALSSSEDLINLYKMYRLLKSDIRPQVHKCLEECKKQLDEAKSIAKTKNFSIQFTPDSQPQESQQSQELNMSPIKQLPRSTFDELKQQDPRLGQGVEEMMSEDSEHGEGAEMMPDPTGINRDKIFPLKDQIKGHTFGFYGMLDAARQIWEQSSNEQVFYNNIEYSFSDDQFDQLIAEYKEQNESLPSNIDKQSFIKNYLISYFMRLYKNGGRPFTRGRKQRVKRFTKGRNRKLRKGKGTRKTYRKKHKTRRR